MDLTTLLGIFIGVGTLLWGMMSGGSLVMFWDPPSLYIVLGGTLAAALISHPMEQVRNLFSLLRVVFVGGSQNTEEVIPVLVHFAEKARREGLLAMEEEAHELGNPLLRKGIQLVVDGVDPELVRHVLEIEISSTEERHAAGRQLFQTMGQFAPAFGMLGTVIGLIQMLADLSTPETIGQGMAVALITTLYGALLANLVFLPIATKLRVRSEQESLIMQLMVEGILSIQAGENPRIVEEKLQAFLSKSEAEARQRRESQAEGAAATIVRQ